jgi:hypothetical protein
MADGRKPIYSVGISRIPGYPDMTFASEADIDGAWPDS